MNTKFSPQAQSRQASVTPYWNNQSQRNGHPSIDFTYSKVILNPKKSESTDTFEMHTLANQRPTLEAFDELEHLVPKENASRAMIVEMSSLFYDQDQASIEIPVIRKSAASSRINFS